jgi:hypothetical protein
VSDGTDLIATALSGALGGGVIVLVGQWLGQFITKPRISIETGTQTPFVVDTDSHVGSQILKTRFVRVQVVNSGLRTARSCRAYILQLSRTSPGGSKSTILDDDPVPLNWSSKGDGDWTVLDISRKFSRLLDLLCAATGASPELQLSSQQIPVRITPMFGDGVYKATIVVTGDNFDPVKVTLDFAYDSGHASLRIV